RIAGERERRREHRLAEAGRAALLREAAAAFLRAAAIQRAGKVAEQRGGGGGLEDRDVAARRELRGRGPLRGLVGGALRERGGVDLRGARGGGAGPAGLLPVLRAQ